MKQMYPSVLEHLRLKVGKRVRLVRTSDPYTRLSPGDEGVVTSVDSLGTLHVSWDNGSSLGLIYMEDDYEVVS